MEIKFNSVTVYRNYNSPIQEKILDKLTLEITKKSITTFYGDHNKEVIGKLICALENPSIGSVKIDKYLISRNRYVKGINNLRFEIGYAFSDPRDYLFEKTVKSEIEFGMKHYKYKLNKINERPIDALKLVGLDESYYHRNPLDLSLSEQKKVMIASIIAYNPKVIIFDEIEKGLNNYDRNNIIRLIKLLKTKHKRTIILISNDIDFIFKCTDYIHVIEKGKLLFSCEKKDLYNEGIGKMIKLPQIIKFVNKAREKGSKLEDYYELNELIKGVYRDVE